MKSPIKKNKVKSGIVIFISILSVFILILRFLGTTVRSTGAYYEPLSWHEIYLTLPLLSIGSIILTLVSLLVLREAESDEERDIENARKRIEEREKKEKENNVKELESDKEK